MRYPIVDLLSPEGALTEERYPIAGSPNPVVRVGVAAVAGPDQQRDQQRDPQWMDTGSDKTALIARIVWLPNSAGVAIERLNRLQNRLDLLFADAATGKSREILKEEDKYWINLADDFQFLNDGKRFLWSSERSLPAVAGGFRHLYLYDLAGKQLAQLTGGNWQVDAVAGIDQKHGYVYFTSTQKSPTERHFYRVPLSPTAAGPAPALQLTSARGTHHADLSPDFAHFLDNYSTATTPARQDLYNADGSRVAIVEENKVAELDRYRLQPVEFFTVPAADGTPLEAELIRPANFNPTRRYPVIVYLYGGPHSSVVRDAWQGADLLWNEMMAQKGFLIFAVDGRGTAGRGHNFETPIFHHFGEVELSDVLAGVSWLKQQSYVDGARLGIWGWSFGGYMTVEAMLRGGGSFKAGFAGAPVTDWRLYDTIYTERYMGIPAENPEGYRESSPVNFAAGLEGKLLIAHAAGDDNVHFANTVELAEKFGAGPEIRRGADLRRPRTRHRRCRRPHPRLQPRHAIFPGEPGALTMLGSNRANQTMGLQNRGAALLKSGHGERAPSRYPRVLPVDAHAVAQHRCAVLRYRHGELRRKRRRLLPWECRVDHLPVAAERFVHLNIDGNGLVVAQRNFVLDLVPVAILFEVGLLCAQPPRQTRRPRAGSPARPWACA